MRLAICVAACVVIVVSDPASAAEDPYAILRDGYAKADADRAAQANDLEAAYAELYTNAPRRDRRCVQIFLFRGWDCPPSATLGHLTG